MSPSRVVCKHGVTVDADCRMPCENDTCEYNDETAVGGCLKITIFRATLMVKDMGHNQIYFPFVGTKGETNNFCQTERRWYRLQQTWLKKRTLRPETTKGCYTSIFSPFEIGWKFHLLG